MTQPEHPPKQPGSKTPEPTSFKDTKVEAVLHELRGGTDKETMRVNKVGTYLADIVRDIGTANNMAKDKFEGNSALMQTAQGFVTGLVGVGLEYGTEQMWDRAWSNTGPIFDRFLYIGGATGKLQKLADNGKSRLYYFIKEGTQDIAMGLLYNFMAFKGQPIFKKMEFKHVFTALTADAAEAFARPGVPEEVAVSLKDQKKFLDVSGELRATKENLANLEHMFKKPDDYKEKASEYQESISRLEAQQQQWEPTVVPLTGWKMWLRNGFTISNPVTHLSLDMMSSGLNALYKNIREVRKVRSERGGLEGKKVFIPRQGGDRSSGDRRPSYDRRQSSGGRYTPDRKQGYQKDKVYYGQAKHNDQKRLEEYELKGN